MYQGINQGIRGLFAGSLFCIGRAGFARPDMYMACSYEIDIRVDFWARKASHLASLFPPCENTLKEL